MFKNFNDIFVKIINKYKPLYMIAYYDMYNMMSLKWLYFMTTEKLMSLLLNPYRHVLNL